jgi:DNA-directed RNA polymerase subunit beta
MSRFHRGKSALRRSFGKIEEVVSLPNLIEVQSKSFNDFVQLDYLPSERKRIGLEKVFQDIFPVEHNDRISLEYVSYELGDWACVCGYVTGLVNRYKWSCTSCKKSGQSRLEQNGTCPHCAKKTASYTRCKRCCSRVVIKMPVTVDECRYSGKSYSMPLKVRLQLLTWDIPEGGTDKIVKDIKEQEVFFCDMPVMVDLYEDQDGCFKLGNQGTFLINGVDRVVVSQIHRAPGVLFSFSKKARDFRGQPSHIARVIPARGAWLDFEFDHNDILYARIDKKKKFLATTLLQALGIERDSIIPLFYGSETIHVVSGNFVKKIDKNLIGQRIEAGAVPEELEDTFRVGQRINEELLEKFAKHKLTTLSVRKSSLINRVLANDLVDATTGEILLQQGGTLTKEIVDYLSEQKKGSFVLIHSSGYVFQPSIALTLAQDANTTVEDAIKEIYCKLRPGDVPSVKLMEEYIHNLFFNVRFYDLTVVGRIRTNRKFENKRTETATHLTKEDIIDVINYLVGLKERGEGELDDIDHLGNRCVRLVGELLQSQLYVGFARIEKIIKERFRLQDNYVSLMPYDFINVKPLSAVMREFFGTGQLSQFMDQTNPLSEMAHKRRLSALGPGGITRERATFEIRDVHTSHYGRICPIETPEGQNIGLISSLSTYSRVNELGFIETAYRPVKNGIVQEEVVYLDAYQELGTCIAQAKVTVDKDRRITETTVMARRDKGDILEVSPTELTHVDASPRQLVSVATALIPFLEHDDANRALMGSNMQRQAVPLVRPTPPVVGTGIEGEIGSTEGAVIAARNSGVVEYVSADKIVVRIDQNNFTEEDWFAKPIDVYTLKKFGRSSHNTWLHYAPVVKPGELVNKGDVLADGAATNNGELALGNDVLAAFMPWNGYNFEDAIVVSNRLVAEDVYTSVHVEEFVAEARDTKLGAEEITRDIPNVGEKELEALDEDGIVRIGTRVKPGDILVGKVTLKGDIQVSPEEKLLRAIFGEKSREVRDTSLRVPPGVEATVVDVKIFSRSGIRKDRRYKDIVAKETEKIDENHLYHLGVLSIATREKIALAVDGVKSKAKTGDFIEKGAFSSEKIIAAPIDKALAIKVEDKALQSRINELVDRYHSQIQVLLALKNEQIARLRKGDDLPSGVIKMVRVYVAMKRSISVGDKVAGRHGNKGVVSRVVNREDMPYLANGRPVDIVLNPLGVPGRMNVGQLLETILGMACKQIGENFAEKINDMGYAESKRMLAQYYGNDLIEDVEKRSGKEAIELLAQKTAKHGLFTATPIFDGADFEQEIRPLLKELNLPERGTYTLYDGRTGEKFDQPVMVGSIYIMKLNHLADDKLHARSVGPYSLITQQPLGGKAQFGGQRLGEMEVWALFAHGAAYLLQEMLTIKSDDVNGRVKAYEAIVRGDEVPEPGIPESFNVLVKELQSLGLQVDLFRATKEQASD